MVNIGLIGCGRWGVNILRDLVTLGVSVHVVARSVASVDRARAGGAASLHVSVAALSEACRLDGIVVATTAHQHYPVIRDVLAKLGPAFPIFCEKPLTVDLKDAEEVAAKAKRLFVMDKWRYHPAVRRMTLARETKEFGDLVGLHARRVQDGNPHLDVLPPYTYLPHDLAIVQDVVGYLPPVVAACSDDEYETVHAMLGPYPWAVLECSTRAVEKVRGVTASFTRGQLFMTDPLATTLLFKGHDGTRNLLDVPGELPLLAELRAFVGYLQGGPAPYSTAKDGCQVVRTVHEILKAAH